MPVARRIAAREPFAIRPYAATTPVDWFNAHANAASRSTEEGAEALDVLHAQETFAGVITPASRLVFDEPSSLGRSPARHGIT